MLKKPFDIIISMVLTLAILCVTCTSAFAATYTGKTYVKEVVLSYGKTSEEAKKWLTDNGYTVLNYDLNEDADDLFSTERAVYLGYKTTKNADEAITDMKLMNMKGGYSVQDYQILLEEQKANIRLFINNFITAINEYRKNYGAGQARALMAHEMLNLLYDPDTEQTLGDLFLGKIKEEYSDEEWEALSDAEKADTADMTTILMQANGASVLAVEQLIALATDSNDSVWSDRYTAAKTYDEMVDALVDDENLTVNKAVKRLAAEYDDDAKSIASKLDGLKSYFDTYLSEDIRLGDSTEKLEAYQSSHENFNLAAWAAAGTQYEVLASLENDDISLLELLTSDEYDVSGVDRYLLYPLVSVLTEGQRACLDFLPMYQLIAMGINGDSAAKTAMDTIDIKALGKDAVSVYDGVDRSVFSSQVALTGDAYRLQNSSDANAADNWFDDGISSATKIMLISLGVAVTASVASLAIGFGFAKGALAASKLTAETETKMLMVSDRALSEDLAALAANDSFELDAAVDAVYSKDPVMSTQMKSVSAIGSKSMWSKVFKYAGAAMLAVSAVLMIWSAWNVYSDLQKYYNVEFTPIPMHMVDQGTNDSGEKIFTYYTAARCNREEAQMVSDSTRMLGSFGDLNGDVGKQWVALYTTKDKAAGNPITADFAVQYKNSNIPGDRTALSMFGESVAQNLTNKSAGYTYADGEGGIYMFYGTDSSAFIGSVFSNKTYVLTGGGIAAVFAVISFFAVGAVRKKKSEGEVKEDA